MLVLKIVVLVVVVFVVWWIQFDQTGQSVRHSAGTEKYRASRLLLLLMGGTSVRPSIHPTTMMTMLALSCNQPVFLFSNMSFDDDDSVDSVDPFSMNRKSSSGHGKKKPKPVVRDVDEDSDDDDSEDDHNDKSGGTNNSSSVVVMDGAENNDAGKAIGATKSTPNSSSRKRKGTAREQRRKRQRSMEKSTLNAITGRTSTAEKLKRLLDPKVDLEEEDDDDDDDDLAIVGASPPPNGINNNNNKDTNGTTTPKGTMDARAARRIARQQKSEPISLLDESSEEESSTVASFRTPRYQRGHKESIRAMRKAERASKNLEKAQNYHAEDLKVKESEEPILLQLSSTNPTDPKWGDKNKKTEKNTPEPLSCTTKSGSPLIVVLRIIEKRNNNNNNKKNKTQRAQGDEKHDVPIKTNQPLRVLMERMIKKGILSQDATVELHFDGEKMDLNKTPASYEMEDEDLVDVLLLK